jgi:hypothetical protein
MAAVRVFSPTGSSFGGFCRAPPALPCAASACDAPALMMALLAPRSLVPLPVRRQRPSVVLVPRPDQVPKGRANTARMARLLQGHVDREARQGQGRPQEERRGLEQGIDPDQGRRQRRHCDRLRRGAQGVRAGSPRWPSPRRLQTAARAARAACSVLASDRDDMRPPAAVSRVSNT